LVTDLTVTESNFQLVGFEDDAAEGAVCHFGNPIRWIQLRHTLEFLDILIRPMSSHRLSYSEM
jgi:hypothetical protein